METRLRRRRPPSSAAFASNLLLPPPLLRFFIKSTRLVQLAVHLFLFSLNLNSYVCFYVGSVCTVLLV